MPPAGPLPAAVQLLKAPKLVELAQFQGEHQDQMLWGTYRPGIYFGMNMKDYAVVCCNSQHQRQLTVKAAVLTIAGSLKCLIGGPHCTGARMRRPAALLAGLMWFDPDHPNAAGSIRHIAQQSDGMCPCL